MNAARFRFAGEFLPGTFLAFARHRARLLALDIHELHEDRGELAVRLSGPAALIDAFEMACTLGPARCIVHDIERRDDA